MGSVLLELAVLNEGGGADKLELAQNELWLEYVAHVHGIFSLAGTCSFAV